MSGEDVLLLWVVGALAVGITIGMIIAYWFLPSDSGNRKLVKQNRELESEQERYRQEVQEHFAKTGELFEGLTRSYRDVYEHLATGAVNLGGGTEHPPELDLPDARRLIEAAHGAAPGAGASESPEAEQKEPVVQAEVAEPATTGEPEADAGMRPEAASPSAEGVDAEEERSAPPAPTDRGDAGEQAAGDTADTEVRGKLDMAEGAPTEAPKSDETVAGEVSAASEPAPPEPRSTVGMSIDEEPEERPRALH